MPFLAKGIMVFGRRNKFKLHLFQAKEKAQRFWEKCKRKGLDAQLVYWAIRGGVKLPFIRGYSLSISKSKTNLKYLSAVAVIASKSITKSVDVLPKLTFMDCDDEALSA